MKFNFNIRKSSMFSILVLLSIIILITSVIGESFSETIVSIDPENQTVGANEDFTISVYCTPGQPIKAYELKLSFDPSLVTANEVTEGDIFDGYSTFFNAGTIDNNAGTIVGIYGLILGPGNVSDPGTLVSISFTGEANAGSSIIGIYDVGITNESAYIPITLVNGTVLVDIIAPEIEDNSPLQGYTGDSYTFNVKVTDNDNSADDLLVKVDWTHGGDGGNDTMVHIGGNYFEKTVILDTFSTLDMTYTIYAVDSYGNSNTSDLASVTVIDNDPPMIVGTYASPSSQEIYGYVNVSSTVFDNIEMNSVFVNITYPDSSWENFSITENETGNIYYCNKTYELIGLYYYQFWADDLEGNSATSTVKTFSIGDMTAPEISNVVLASSDPLDTDSSFGWVSITCDVDDNVAVDDVSIIITNPDDSTNNVTLAFIIGDSYNINSTTAFSQVGNYTYHIWADDTSNNNAESINYYFSMPPNWDVNNDGAINIFDLVSVSNHYDESGDQGWIREDIDNNGQIEVFDLVLVSNHFGEVWWEA